MKGNKMKKLYSIFVYLLLVGTILAASTIVGAPKPEKPGKPGGGGPIPTGTIFFMNYDETETAVWTMNPDGSGKTKVTVATDEVKVLSRSKHGEHYWYMGFVDVEGTYPDGSQCRELFAVRDDNTKSIQLTDDATLKSNGQPVWGIDDNKISWAAVKWVYNTEWSVEEAGIYSASTTFDSNNDLIGLGSITLTWETEPYQGANDYWRPGVGPFDYSPDGNKMVMRIGSALYIADLTNSNKNYLTNGHTPQWSPDSTKIGFIGGPDDVRTIEIDGSNEQIIAQPRFTRAFFQNLRTPRWSPDSNYLSYLLIQHSYKHSPPITTYVYRIRVDGSDNSCLTKQITNVDNVGWR